MKIGILGTGMVGMTLATRLAGLGHDVMMGARAKDNEKANAWAAEHDGKAGDFADASAHGEMVFNCTKGEASVAALQQAGADNLRDKVVVDLANPLEFTDGELSLSIVNTDSLAETLQRKLPGAKIVKALNTMNCEVMVDPKRVPGNHAVFIAGDDADAKSAVADILKSFGWQDILDLGDLKAARGMEMLMPAWIKLMRAFGTADFNWAIARQT